VPQIGAVVVPINYRLTADDFAHLIDHSGARVVCAHSDYLAALEGIRPRFGKVSFVALEGAMPGWLDYEKAITESEATIESPPIAETDLLTINYTSGITSRPKG
jgi:fatty-acyl-CoA synthase